MSAPNGFNPKLPVARDNHILSHVHRHGITRLEVLQRLFFPKASINAVSQTTGRLRKAGYLTSHPLCHKTTYLTLGPRCRREFSVPRSKTEPRGEQALPIDLGALAFCCLQEEVRRRLLPHELLAEFPWFPKQYLCHPFCLVTDGGERRLAIIKTELSDYPNKVVRKHTEQLHAFRGFAPLAQLIAQRRFMVVTVTTTPERRDAFISEFSSNPWYPAFAVFDYPDLCHLL